MSEKEANETNKSGARRPNILILCLDQWEAHMKPPDGVRFPAMERLEARGVSFDRQYCTYPVCTPSRSTMWTGVHAVHTGLWDNTNFAYIDELRADVPTIGQMLREQGYYTAFKGKWHLSATPRTEDALERYGFSDYQQWGDMFGGPLQGEQLDGTIAFETVDWLETKGKTLDQPWLMVCSLVNPHDVMFLQHDETVQPHEYGIAAGMQTTVQDLGWFQKDWDVEMPENFNDDYALQPWGVRNYKEHVDLNFGRIPDEREDLWLKHRNYLINCMRLVDAEFNKVLDALERLDLWDDTIVIFTGDHGEMNAAHRLTQKGSITFDEAIIVNFTVCVPGGEQGKRTGAVGSHLDLAPTLLDFAGLNEQEMREKYPQIKGRSLKSAILEPETSGPRGSSDAPGDGALYLWDALHSLDNEWVKTGALQSLTSLGSDPSAEQRDRKAQLIEAGEKLGAPDFKKRAFYRTVVDGQYKLVRWFSPENYGNPTTLEELYEKSDVGLYDLLNDPGELENLAHPQHPKHAPALVERMLQKLHQLVTAEIGEDRAPFDLDMFGTREVKYKKEKAVSNE